MAPLTPHWVQPSHPTIQKVLINKEKEFSTKSISLVHLPPYALFAKFSFPPCTHADEPTYATVQVDSDQHMNLNSDLVYINHSCEPSVIFDTSSLLIIAGPKGLKAGDELTFFYPSTEWDMAQGFECFCGAERCRGFISGAKNMTREQLEGNFLNAHIRGLVEERDAEIDRLSFGDSEQSTNGNVSLGRKDATEEALQASLLQAKKVVDAAQCALDTYKSLHGHEYNGTLNGGKRRGITSRELSGEMGGDTNA